MSKATARIRRSKKLRATLQKVELMRISISRSLKNITAQLIDSSNGKVLATASTQQKSLKSKISDVHQNLIMEESVEKTKKIFN